MVTKITDSSEYNAIIQDADWMEIQRASNGASYKVSPNKKVGLRAGVQMIDPTSSVGVFSLPGVLTNDIHTTFSIASVSYVYLTRFVVHSSITITDALLVVTTLKAASVVRLGVYSADEYWNTVDLIADLGTVDSTTTGRKVLTGLSLVLNPGPYFTACASSVAAVICTSQAVSPFTMTGASSPASVSSANVYAAHHRSGTLTTPALSGLPLGSGVGAVTGTIGPSVGEDSPVFFRWTEN